VNGGTSTATTIPGSHLAGMRRRGVTRKPSASFCKPNGHHQRTKPDRSAVLEDCIGKTSTTGAARDGGHEPGEGVLTNYPEGESEELDVVNNPRTR